MVTGGRLASPAGTLDCMNSGSTVRMLLGACAGAGLSARFDGDDSLRRRPMEPVAAQLRAFGAKIETAEGHLPLRLSGTPEVETRHFILLSALGASEVRAALRRTLCRRSGAQSTATAAHAITPNGFCAISERRYRVVGAQHSPGPLETGAQEARGCRRLFGRSLLHYGCDGNARQCDS